MMRLPPIIARLSAAIGFGPVSGGSAPISDSALLAQTLQQVRLESQFISAWAKKIASFQLGLPRYIALTKSNKLVAVFQEPHLEDSVEQARRCVKEGRPDKIPYIRKEKPFAFYHVLIHPIAQFESAQLMLAKLSHTESMMGTYEAPTLRFQISAVSEAARIIIEGEPLQAFVRLPKR